MKGLQEIKNRIKVVQNSYKIARAMYLISSAKIGYIQKITIDSKEYINVLSQIINILIYKITKEYEYDLKKEKLISFLNEKPILNKGILIMSTEKGLCGSINSSLLNKIPIGKNIKFFTIGKTIFKKLNSLNYNIVHHFEIKEKFYIYEIEKITEILVKYFINNEIDDISIIYPKFINKIIHIPTIHTILPISSINDDYVINNQFSIFQIKNYNEKINLLENTIYQFITQCIYQSLLETRASEHSNRMMTMKKATDNAKNIILELKIEHNKLRQVYLTKEILELSSSKINSEF